MWTTLYTIDDQADKPDIIQCVVIMNVHVCKASSEVTMRSHHSNVRTYKREPQRPTDAPTRSGKLYVCVWVAPMLIPYEYI